MPGPLKAIEIRTGHEFKSYDEASKFLDALNEMGDASCHVKRTGSDTQPIFHLYQRGFSHWLEEKWTAFWASTGDEESAKKLRQLQNNKRDAMIAIASALGIEITEGSENRKKLKNLIPLNESKSLKFGGVAKIVAPEAGSLSKLSFEIGDFKKFDKTKQWRRVYVAQRIVKKNPAGVRLDIDKVNEKMYLRTRSRKEASEEQRMTPKDLEEIRSDVAIEIAHAFMPKTAEEANRKKKGNDDANDAMEKTISKLLSDITKAISAGKEQYRFPDIQSVPKDQAALDRSREKTFKCRQISHPMKPLRPLSRCLMKIINSHHNLSWTWRKTSYSVSLIIPSQKLKVPYFRRYKRLMGAMGVKPIIVRTRICSRTRSRKIDLSKTLVLLGAVRGQFLMRY